LELRLNMKPFKKRKMFLMSQPLLTSRRYFWGKIMVVILIAAFIITFSLTLYYWCSIQWYYKILLAFIIWCLAPKDMDTLRTLRMSYDEYKRQWEEQNKEEGHGVSP
jgi:hypothetical protein